MNQETAKEPRKPCMVRVVVTEPDQLEGPFIHDQTGDYNQRYFREWIDKTQWWAMRDGKKVFKMVPMD